MPDLHLYVRHLFSTEAEAKAFVIGVQYVNDDAITVDSDSILSFNVGDPTEYWMVRVEDDDADEEYTVDHREDDDAGS